MKDQVDRIRKEGHPALYEPPTTVVGILTERGLSTSVAKIVERNIRRVIEQEHEETIYDRQIRDYQRDTAIVCEASEDPNIVDLNRRVMVIEEAFALAQSQVSWGPMGPNVNPLKVIDRLDTLERSIVAMASEIEEMKKEVSEINKHIIWKGNRDHEDV